MEEKAMMFIDGANLNKSAENLGFRIDYMKLKEFLEDYLKRKGCQLIRPYYYTAGGCPTIQNRKKKKGK